MAGDVDMLKSDQLGDSWLLQCNLAEPDPNKQLCSVISGESAGSIDIPNISLCAAASAMLHLWDRAAYLLELRPECTGIECLQLGKHLLI